MIHLPRTFYARETVTVAEGLLGKLLIRHVRGVRLVGRVIETEAYRGSDDPASHAARGMTARNRVMFGQPGHAYVYFTYGMHFCFNIVAHKAGLPGAVLIRALEPLEGLEFMARRRGRSRPQDLASGPAKLTQAFAIRKFLNGHDLTSSLELYVARGSLASNEHVEQTRRIGVDSDGSKPWRFCVQPSRFVSRLKP